MTGRFAKKHPGADDDEAPLIKISRHYRRRSRDHRYRPVNPSRGQVPRNFRAKHAGRKDSRKQGGEKTGQIVRARWRSKKRTIVLV